MEQVLQKIFEEYRETGGNVITILQDIQKSFGYIPEYAVTWFSKKLNIPSSRFFGTATFYSEFHLRPRGRHVVSVCRGTACHMKGSEKLLERLLIELDISPHEETTPDMKISVARVNCLGACGIAPVTMLDKTILGNTTFTKLAKEIKKLKTGE